MRALILSGFLFSLLFAAPGLTMFIPAALSQSLHTGKARPLTFLEPARGSTTELNLGSGKATLHHTEDFEVFVTGTDRNGKPWSVHPGGPSAPGLQAMTGDLDQDGQNDLVLISLTGANGNLPGQIVSIITFETDGKPLLFTTWTTEISPRASRPTWPIWTATAGTNFSCASCVTTGEGTSSMPTP